MCVSKESNSVISYLHHFFSTWGLRETEVHLHCYNCSGQNKNKYMLWYFMWRAIHGLHTNVHLHFLISGHSKFSPGWCFGLLKQRFRWTPVSTLADIEEVVRPSTVTGSEQTSACGLWRWHCYCPNIWLAIISWALFQDTHWHQSSPSFLVYSLNAWCYLLSSDTNMSRAVNAASEECRHVTEHWWTSGTETTWLDISPTMVSVSEDSWIYSRWCSSQW